MLAGIQADAFTRNNLPNLSLLATCQPRQVSSNPICPIMPNPAEFQARFPSNSICASPFVASDHLVIGGLRPASFGQFRRFGCPILVFLAHVKRMISGLWAEIRHTHSPPRFHCWRLHNLNELSPFLKKEDEEHLEGAIPNTPALTYGRLAPQEARKSHRHGETLVHTTSSNTARSNLTILLSTHP